MTKKQWTAREIVKLHEDYANEDFVAILCDEYFPHIEGAEFWDMRTRINCLSNEILTDVPPEERISKALADEVYDLFTEAFCAYHQVPDEGHLSHLRK